jgi:hypothetical protein
MRAFIELKGGLGNQIFQLAFGMWLTKGRTELLTFDISHFKRVSRPFALLQYFSVPGASFIETGYDRCYGELINLDNRPDVFDESLNRQSRPCWYSGYFQHYKYLEDNKLWLQSAFQTKFLERPTFSETCIWNADPKILRCAIHVRRGDYLSQDNQKIYGLIDCASLVDEARRISAKIANERALKKVQICLFSDSFDLQPDFNVSRKLSAFGITPTEKTRLEFYLMTRADLLICSNSTFGYWAGILNSKGGKMYIPSQWTKSGIVSSSSLLGEQMETYQPLMK